jgi:hypothetical protein
MCKWIVIITAMLLGAATIRTTRGQQVKCNQAIDWVVQARELARPGVSRTRLERMKALLNRATDHCSDYGDAWYYRALYARELNDRKDQEFALRKAEQANAEAWRLRNDPFAPAAPLPTPALTTTNANAPVKADPATPGAPATKPPAFRPVREKWAVVVGISKFRDGQITPLTYTAKDAKDFAALLTDAKYGRFKPGNMTLLTDEQATVKAIKSAIGRLMDNAQPDDLVVCYISTHGSPRAGGQAEANYIVTHDTEVADLYATSLAMVNVVDDLSKHLKAQRVVLFLDTCYSGAATGADTLAGAKELGMAIPQDLLSRVDRTAGRMIITASKDDELSWESPTLKNSVFTYYLMQALKQDQGQSSIEQVYGYLKEQVARHMLAEPRRVRGITQTQTPLLRGNTLQGQLDIRIGIAPQSR